MLNKIKIGFINFLAGIIIGIISMIIFFKHNELTDSIKTIETKQISGKKITHTNWDFKGKNIFYKTESEGKGVIETKIPKILIPEFNEWENKNNIIQISLLYLPYEDTTHSPIGISYLKRRGTFCFGGGVIFSKEILGLQVSGQYLF